MSYISIDKIQKNHRIIADYEYKILPVIKGYANRTLYINLSDNAIYSKDVTQNMKDTFTGGRGFCLWLLWNAVNSDTRWDDSENEIVIAGGPIGGITAYPGTGKATVVTISPLTNVVVDSNSGGYFGPYLKFSGWDALEIQGKSEKDVVIFIDGDNGRVQIEEAPLDPIDTHLINRLMTDLYTGPKGKNRNISVVSAGQAADYVAICGLNISYYDPKRNEVRIKQAARGGSGRVFRDKGIKAIVVRYSNLNANSNGVANMALIRKAGKRINNEIKEFDPVQNDMRHLGTTHLIEIINAADLLPVENFRFSTDVRANKINADYWRNKFDARGPDGCWYGCTMECAHGVSHYHIKTGPYKGQVVMVNGPEYETLAGLGSNVGIFDPSAILEFNFYCDTYGIDTISLGNSIAFAMECYEMGIINEEITGGIELTWGNADAVLELIHQMSQGVGFGVIIGQGVRFMKNYFINKYGADPDFLQDIGMEIKGLEISEYVTKESLAQQGGYALATKGPQHDEAWLIFMEMVHKQIPTFEDKAEALYYFPIWRTWFSLHGLCKLPWNDIVPESNKTAAEPAKVPEHVENYTWLYEGVTGIKVTPEDLILQSERVYQFQRVFNLKMGYGTRECDYPPYRAVGPVTEVEYEYRADRYDKELSGELNLIPSEMRIDEKIAALRKYRMGRYEQLVDAVYKRRGWNSNGIPKVETLQRFGIDFQDVIDLVQKTIVDHD